ncbi:hypothetical protein PG985_001860 [Apiospora marii]|uniref:uncharacterized protein n=1 Tax=Apiospora marii TaxID=335849 RepID=UPI0031311C2C
MTDTDALAVTCLIITTALAVFAIMVVGLRLYARHAIDALGIDDALMVIATCLFVVNSVFSCLACFAGLGSRDEKILTNPWNGPAATMITYAWSLPFIKCSICFSLFRITNERRHTIPLWGVMLLSTVSAMLGFIAVVVTCQPIAKNWDPALTNVGSCMDYSIIQNTSFFISASSIITDWTCAVLPYFILWKMNIKRKVKVSVALVLALGAVASLSTIVRLPYLSAYTTSVDHYYKCAHIVIWSEVECGVGIIAGSLPSLRGFFKYIRDRSSAQSSDRCHFSLDDNENSHRFVAIGGTGGDDDRTAAAAASNVHNNMSCEANTGSSVPGVAPAKSQTWVDLEGSKE